MKVVRIELQIIEKYKGDSLRKIITVYTPLLSASCGYHFQNGEEYIVYGSKANFLRFLFKKEGESKLYERESAFWTTHCTRTTNYIKSEAEELRLLSKRVN